ncbi:MAG: hypothetical protein AAGG38_13610 [Planctomycetota bacterium]
MPTNRRTPTVLILFFGLVAAAGLLPAQAQTDAADPPPPPPPETETEAASTPRDTPQAVFDAAQSAFNARDWNAFVALVSPPRRDQLVGQTALVLANAAQDPEADPRMIELAQRYVPRDVDPMQLMLGSDDPKAEAERLGKRIGRPAEFYAAATKLFFDLQYPDPDTAPQITGLTELALGEDGRSATSQVVLRRPNGEAQDTWTYELHDGQWYLSMR